MPQCRITGDARGTDTMDMRLDAVQQHVLRRRYRARRSLSHSLRVVTR